MYVLAVAIAVIVWALYKQAVLEKKEKDKNE